MRTVPVNHSAGPLIDGCVPGLLSSILFSQSPDFVTVKSSRSFDTVDIALGHPA
jgi:hypothetical protein